MHVQYTQGLCLVFIVHTYILELNVKLSMVGIHKESDSCQLTDCVECQHIQLQI
jgi:hypothetical protein